MPQKHPDLAKNPPGANGAGRAREIVASLRTGEPTDVFDAFWQLDELPVDEVRDALVAWTGPLPAVDRPLRLRTLSVATDADVLDLGPVAEEQLRLAGKSWDGASLSPEERLDGELEGSFAGTLERRVLADADAPGETPLFDVLLFAENAGVVFAAGTTKMVAMIAYGKVEMRDRRVRVALEEAIAPEDAHSKVEDPAPEAAPPAAPETAVAKTRAVAKKKTVPKKAAVAKKATVAKKTAVAKKTTVAKKKTVAKKAAKKKTAARG